MLTGKIEAAHDPAGGAAAGGPVLYPPAGACGRIDAAQPPTLKKDSFFLTTEREVYQCTNLLLQVALLEGFGCTAVREDEIDTVPRFGIAVGIEQQGMIDEDFEIDNLVVLVEQSTVNCTVPAGGSLAVDENCCT